MSRRKGKTLSPVEEPKANQKRLRNTKKITYNKESDEDEQSQSVESKPIKKGTKKQIKEVQNNLKGQPALKINQNEKIKLIPKVCNQLDGAMKDPQDKCCSTCTNRDLIRAAKTRNINLFKTLLKNHSISNPYQFWSPDDKTNVLQILLSLNDKILLAEYAKYIKEHKWGKDTKIYMTQNDTGYNRKSAYGAYTRKVTAGRKNREGNNAFLRDPQKSEYVDEDITGSCFRKHFDYSALQYLEAQQGIDRDVLLQYYSSVNFPIRQGNYKLAGQLIEQMQKQGVEFGFNQLHVDVLKAKPALTAYKSTSVTKKTNGTFNITPLHCAAINPDSKVLETLLSINNEPNIFDDLLRRPIHYAAACESIHPLQLLLNKGVDALQADKFKTTPFHIAAKEGRLQNLKILAKLSNVTAKNRSGQGAIHFATQHGHLDCVKELVETHDQLEWPGPNKSTPLILAAQYGHYDVVEYLLEKKAKINKKDKYGKTALSQAVINGYLRVAALLLQKGADQELPDSSNNYPLHYAAAYGFYECLDILIQAGADVNVKNSWNLTPLSVALQKGHKVTVRKLLERKDIDVNCKDDTGKTLIVQEIIHHKEITEHLRYLIEVKKADVNITDLKGRAAIHYAMASEDKIDQVQLLIDNGADINLSSEKGGSPFIIALLSQNFKGTQLLKRHPNFDLLAKDKDGKNILSQLISKDAFYDAEYGCSIILEIAKDFPREALEQLNSEGFNIMHELLIEFYTTANVFSQVLLRKKIKQHLQSQYYALREEKIKKKKQELIQSGRSKKKGGRRAKNVDMDVEGSDENNEENGSEQNSDEDNDDNQVEDEEEEEEDNVPKKKNQTRKSRPARPSKPARSSKPAKKSKSAKPIKQKSLIEDKDEDSPFEIEKDNNDSDSQNDDELNKGHMTVSSVNTQEVQKQKSQKSDSSVELISSDNEEVSDDDEIDNPVQKQRKQYKEQVNSILMMLWYKGDRYYFRDVINDKYTPFEISDFVVPYIVKTNSQYKNYKKEITPKLSDVKTLIQEVIAYVNLVEQKVYNIAKVLNCETQIKGKYQLEHYQYAYYPRNIEKSKALDHLKRTPFHFLATYAQSSMLYDLKEIVKQNLPIQDSTDLNGDTVYGQLALRGLYYEHVNVCNNFNQVPLFEWIKVRQVHRDLLEKADPNFTDKDGRNALHFAVMYNDQETLHHLLQKGVNQSQKDKYGRTPLFYAFIQNNQLLYKDNYEPFELVSYLLKDVNQVDNYGRTCLHYAAQRGSSMSARQIISKGAQINIVDKFGNTPLGTAFWANHSEFCTMLIDNHAEINHQVNQINQKALIADCIGLQKSNPLKFYKQRSFRQKFEQGFTEVDFLDYKEDFMDDSKLIFKDDEDKIIDEIVRKIEQFYKRSIIKPILEAQTNQKKRISDSEEEEEEEEYDSDGEPKKKIQQENLNQDSEQQTSYYYAAQQKGWNQVAYILISNGYSMIQALEDTFRLKKFEFIIYLLMRAEQADLIKTNDKNQNLYHFLAKYSNHKVTKDYIEKIIRYSKDVDFNSKDIYQQTPLHFACQNVCLPLINWLLQQAADPNSKDQFNNTPFVYLLQKQEHKKIDLLQWKSFGFNIAQDIYIDGLQTGPLIYLVRNKRAQNINFIKYYLDQGVDINQKDSNGQTLLHAAIYINSTKIVKLILESGQFQLNIHIDQDGRTPLHHVVKPLEFGSYENSQILQLLLKHYDPLQKDNIGLTPYDYACQFESSELRQILKKYQNEPTQMIRRAPTSILNETQWGKTVDFINDAHEYLKDQVKQKKYEVDFTIQGHQYSVYGEYSVLMTKVDVYSGYYSQNVFYKMQVLHEKVRDVFILLTRWGRIGDRGQHQHTPFQKVEDCLKEFTSVYKQKTGNEWGQPYQKKSKKYHILKQKQFRNTVKHLKPFDQSIKSELDKDVHEVVQNFAQVQLYQDYLKKNNIRDDTLESLDKEELEAAENIMNEIEKVSKQLEQVRKEGITDLEQYKKLVDEIAELSNRFYEHLPETDRQDQHVVALSDPNKIHEKSNLVRTLQIFETASKIILAAVSKQNIINPIQYCFEALNIKMIQLKKEDIEYKMIERYIRDYKKISRVFSVERKHEVENFKKYDNRMLLWHGTRTYNYLGILSNGLKIAPYKVGRHGNLFGNGIYFADFLEKSYSYCHGDENITNKNYILLCEVSLGKVQEFKHSEQKNIEFERSYKFNSVMCLGAKSPDFKQNVILSNGCKVPIGDEIKVKDCLLGFNEYIVYNENQVRIRYIVEI